MPRPFLVLLICITVILLANFRIGDQMTPDSALAAEIAKIKASEARRVYAKYIEGGEPPMSDYKALQDYLFRYIANEAGRIGLPVHIHVGAGASGYFNQSGAMPFILEPVLNDPRLRKTQFILLHGGFPFAREARALAYKPNVYLDCSGLTFPFRPENSAKSCAAGWSSCRR